MAGRMSGWIACGARGSGNPEPLNPEPLNLNPKALQDPPTTLYSSP